jgi:hypothetical protein
MVRKAAVTTIEIIRGSLYCIVICILTCQQGHGCPLWGGGLAVLQARQWLPISGLDMKQTARFQAWHFYSCQYCHIVYVWLFHIKCHFVWQPESLCCKISLLFSVFSDSGSDMMFTRKCEILLIASGEHPPPSNFVGVFSCSRGETDRITGIHFMQRLRKMHMQMFPSQADRMLSALECCQYACHMFTACETKALWPWGGLCRQGERRDPALVSMLWSSGLW